MSIRPSLLRWLVLLSLLIPFVPAHAADLLRDAGAAIEQGRYAQAADMLHAQIQQQGGSVQGWFLLGVAHARQQQFNQAIEAFRQVIALDPALAEPHYNLAAIYNELGDVHAAVRELERSLQKKPGDAVAEENLAELHLNLALHYYRQTLEKSPTTQLQRRYTRLLHVRDPHASDAPVQVAAAEPEVQENVHRSEAEVAAVSPASASIPVVEPVSRDRAAVLAAIEGWRAAWSAQNLEGYYAAYGDDFTLPQGFVSDDAWKRYKERVILGKAYIHVELRDVQVQFNADKSEATVRFSQSFRSDSYSSDDEKVLLLKRHGRDWKISREDSIS